MNSFSLKPFDIFIFFFHSLGKVCIPITKTKTTILKYDAIVVTCKTSTKFYTNVHHLVQKRNIRNKNFKGLKNKINVIIFGTDSVSRLNFMRSQPETHRYLTKELKAFDFKGYNKVADNTFPNLMPALMGLTKKELESNPCFNNSRGSQGKARKYDDCPIIWKDFKKHGYITTYFEVNVVVVALEV